MDCKLSYKHNAIVKIHSKYLRTRSYWVQLCLNKPRTGGTQSLSNDVNRPTIDLGYLGNSFGKLIFNFIRPEDIADIFYFDGFSSVLFWTIRIKIFLITPRSTRCRLSNGVCDILLKPNTSSGVFTFLKILEWCFGYYLKAKSTLKIRVPVKLLYVSTLSICLATCVHFVHPSPEVCPGTPQTNAFADASHIKQLNSRTFKLWNSIHISIKPRTCCFLVNRLFNTEKERAIEQ